ncbi:hypothetical protein T484DRAFT_1899873, partial [Baffinella frigidus]
FPLPSSPKDGVRPEHESAPPPNPRCAYPQEEEGGHQEEAHGGGAAAEGAYSCPSFRQDGARATGLRCVRSSLCQPERDRRHPRGGGHVAHGNRLQRRAEATRPPGVVRLPGLLPQTRWTGCGCEISHQRRAAPRLLDEGPQIRLLRRVPRGIAPLRSHDPRLPPLRRGDPPPRADPRPPP